MKNKKKISIIIPIYNSELYLRQCIDSIIAQKIDKEIICIDDGSTDSSRAILEEYKKKIPCMDIIKSKHIGTGAARNIGIEASTGEYIAFMDSDDYYPKDQVLEKLYDLGKTMGTMIIGGNIVSINSAGEQSWHGDYFSREGFYNYRELQDIYGFKKYIYDRRLFEGGKNLFPPYVRFEDPPFFMNIMSENDNFYACKDIVYCHRVGNKTVKFSRDIALGMIKGIRDSFVVASKYDLKIAYERQLKNKLKEHFKNIYRFLYVEDEDFWGVINDIYSIEERWKATNIWRIDRGIFRTSIDEYFIMVKKLEYLKENNNPLIIYGAGVVGIGIYDAFLSNYSGVLGFAVTSIDNIENEKVQGCYVKCINDYLDRKEATVIIGLKNEDLQDQICDLLYGYGFFNVIKTCRALCWMLGI